jgi:hypothetical protein
MSDGNDRARGRAGGLQRQFDLEERTARFGEAIIAFAKKIPVIPVTEPLIRQLVKAGTSVGFTARLTTRDHERNSATGSASASGNHGKASTG